MASKYSSEGVSVLDTMAQAGRFNEWMYESVRPFVKGDIIEFGCGRGTFSRMLARDFPHSRILLSDFDPALADQLRKDFTGSKNITARQADLCRKPDFAGLEGKFDTAIALNVMEHVPDDLAALANIRLLLRPGGRFVMLVPAYRGLYGEVDKSIGHHRRYSKSDVKAKAIKSGFKVQKIRYFNFPGIVGWLVNGKILKKKTIDENAMAAYNKIIPAVKLVDPLLSKVAGLSIIAVLEK